MKTKSMVLFIFLMTALLLSSCSSGPPDYFLLADFTGDLNNVQIKRKIECNEISTEAKALGIEKAWLVAFEYDSPLVSVGHVSNYVALYVYAEDKWQSQVDAYIKYGVGGRPTCP